MKTRAIAVGAAIVGAGVGLFGLVSSAFAFGFYIIRKVIALIPKH